MEEEKIEHYTRSKNHEGSESTLEINKIVNIRRGRKNNDNRLIRGEKC